MQTQEFVNKQNTAKLSHNWHWESFCQWKEKPLESTIRKLCPHNSVHIRAGTSALGDNWQKKDVKRSKHTLFLTKFQLACVKKFLGIFDNNLEIKNLETSKDIPLREKEQLKWIIRPKISSLTKWNENRNKQVADHFLTNNLLN